MDLVNIVRFFVLCMPMSLNPIAGNGQGANYEEVEKDAYHNLVVY
jgi:hypothetical protein